MSDGSASALAPLFAGQWNGQREAGAEHRVRETFGGDIGGGAAGRSGGVEHRSLSDHLNLLLQFAGTGGTFHAAATGQHGVVAASPVHGIFSRWGEQRQQPKGGGGG